MIVNFYATHQDNILKVLAMLLQKIKLHNDKAIILATNQEEAEYVDNYLWAQSGWLPHSLKHGEYEKDANIVISYDSNINDFANNIIHQAKYLFVINNALLLSMPQWDKVCIIFDQNDESTVAFNRNRWKEYTLLNWELYFYNQEKNGKFTQILI